MGGDDAEILDISDVMESPIQAQPQGAVQEATAQHSDITLAKKPGSSMKAEQQHQQQDQHSQPHSAQQQEATETVETQSSHQSEAWKATAPEQAATPSAPTGKEQQRVSAQWEEWKAAAAQKAHLTEPLISQKAAVAVEEEKEEEEDEAEDEAADEAQFQNAGAPSLSQGEVKKPSSPSLSQGEVKKPSSLSQQQHSDRIEALTHTGAATSLPPVQPNAPVQLAVGQPPVQLAVQYPGWPPVPYPVMPAVMPVMPSTRHGKCQDDAHFRDATKQQCSEWVGYSCYSFPGYNSMQMLAIRHSCPVSCKIPCQCADDYTFGDAYGNSCLQWMGFSCQSTYAGYNDNMLEDIRRHCPVTCKMPCQGFDGRVALTSSKIGNGALCATVGSAGTGPGVKCAFPFKYQGHAFNSCTTAGHTVPWCATLVDEYSGEQVGEHWGDCSDSCTSCATEGSAGAGPGHSCVFPFKYEGQIYNTCINVDHTVPWCAIAVDHFRHMAPNAWGDCSNGCQATVGCMCDPDHPYCSSNDKYCYRSGTQIFSDTCPGSCSSHYIPQAVPYDCLQGLAHWQATWSFGKKEWCCANQQVGCSEPWDCRLGLEGWRFSWPVEKKQWCCQYHNTGCEAPPQPPPMMYGYAPEFHPQPPLMMYPRSSLEEQSSVEQPSPS